MTDLGVARLTPHGRRRWTGTGPDKFETTADADTYEVSTPDGLRGAVAHLTWPTGDVTVQLIDHVEGPSDYHRLEQVGRMLTKMIAGRRVAVVQQLAYHSKPHRTLGRATWEQFDSYTGTCARTLLQRLGATRTALCGDLDPLAGRRYQNDVAIEVPDGVTEPLVAAWVLSRVLPIAMG